MREVLVTGIGMVSSLGLNRRDTFASLLEGKSGVCAARSDIKELLPQAIAALLPPGFNDLVGRAEAGLDHATRLGIVASREALRDAQFDIPSSMKSRVGVYVGVGLGGAISLDELYTKFFRRKLKAESGDPILVHPMTVPRIMPNSTAAWISIENGFRGPSNTYSVA